MRLWAVLLSMMLMPAGAMAAPAQAPAQVVVLAALHRMHEQVPAYSGQVLSASIQRLAPDVLCLEVTPDRLQARAPEANKIEYPQVVYPLLERGNYALYAMEPPEPLYTQIGAAYMQATQAYAAAHPEDWEAFTTYGRHMYASLRSHWTGPAQVNDAVTDQMLRARHALQEALIGPGERDGWEAWNMHFLKVITQAAREHPGKRIVVVVGAEHGYWLRERLDGLADVQLMDTTALLAN
jgi:truncated hemoglobin YjbI